MEVVRDVAVHGTRERGHEPVEQFHGTEVELDREAGTVKLVLPFRGQLLHALERADEDRLYLTRLDHIMLVGHALTAKNSSARSVRKYDSKEFEAGLKTCQPTRPVSTDQIDVG